MLSVEIKSQNDSPTKLEMSVEVPLDEGICGIMGPSGCGKTTLLRVLCGLETRYQGKVQLNDRVLFDTEQNVDIQPHLRDIGLVFQDARLFPHLTVQGNLAFARKRSTKGLFEIEQVSEWFGLNTLLDKSISMLSGGQKQRVAVARAILHCPQLLLLDEPFVSLDMAGRSTLLECLKTVYRQTRIPMLFVSHDIHDIRQLCERLLLMNDGEIAQQGETFHLLNQLQTGLKLACPIAATLHCQPCGRVEGLPLTQLKLSEQYLLSSEETDNEQALVQCVIKATDVSISLEHVSDCSIANCLATVLTEITVLDEHNVVLTLSLQEQVLYAQITRYSLKRLGLTPNMTLYALIKASAVSLL